MTMELNVSERARRAALLQTFCSTFPERREDALVLSHLLSNFADARFPHALFTAWQTSLLQKNNDHKIDVVFGRLHSQPNLPELDEDDVGLTVEEVLIVAVGSHALSNTQQSRKKTRDDMHRRLNRSIKGWQLQYPEHKVLAARYGNDVHYLGKVAVQVYGPSATINRGKAGSTKDEVMLPDMKAPPGPLPIAETSAPSMQEERLDRGRSFDLPTKENLKLLGGKRTIFCFFGCEPCKLLWPRRVQEDKPFSTCKRCNTMYERIALHEEPVGIGFFKCTDCSRKWTSRPSARDVGQPCYGCQRKSVEPYRVLPFQLMDEDADRPRGPRRSDYKHSCAHCRTFSTVDGKCPLYGRGRVSSKPVDTRSVQSSILSGASVRFYRAENITQFKQQHPALFAGEHVHRPFDDVSECSDRD